MNLKEQRAEIFRLIAQKHENKTFLPDEAYIFYMCQDSDYEVICADMSNDDFWNVLGLYLPECEKVEYFDPFKKEYKRIL